VGDPLRAARGIMNGLFLGLILWCLIVLAVVAAIKAGDTARVTVEDVVKGTLEQAGASVNDAFDYPCDRAPCER
jgi:hypothetical protein